MTLNHRISTQLQCPRGMAGWWVGQAMTLANRRANRVAIDRLEVRPFDNVLEIGFGPGKAVAQLAALATSGRVCGIDLSPVMLRQARRRNAAGILRGQVDLRLGDFRSLPYADASFDRIAAINVVYFWYDDAVVMKEILRVSRTGARIVVYATHRQSMEKWSFARTGCHRLYDECGLRDLFLNAGVERDGVDVTSCDVGFGVAGICAAATKTA